MLLYWGPLIALSIIVIIWLKLEDNRSLKERQDSPSLHVFDSTVPEPPKQSRTQESGVKPEG